MNDSSRAARVRSIEASLQHGPLSREDAEWLLDQVRTAPGPRHFFNLAPARALAPDVLAPNTPFDQCMLALALLFNDLKDLVIVDDWLRTDRPDPDAVSEYGGQWFGMFNHVSRIGVGMLHEFLQLLEQHERLFESEDFRTLLATTPRRTRAAWHSLLRLAKKDRSDSHPNSHDPEIVRLYNAFRDIRNQTAFHYKHWKRLCDGYRQYFEVDASRPEQQSVYVSISDSIDGMRFYYADGAALGHNRTLERTHDLPLPELISKTLSDLNLALGPLVANYVSRRSGGLTREIADSIPPKKHHGSKQRRQKRKR